jgi:hypothetical protein
MKKQIHAFGETGANFLLAAPTYKIMKQSMLPYFLEAMEGMGKYNSSDSVFEMRSRRRVYMRTETDPDSIVGIPNIKAGWLDEAGKLRLYFYENYQARAAAKGARTLLTTSPYARNWLWKDLVKPAREGLRPDIKLIQAASWENPYHTLSDPLKRAEMRERMSAARFDMIYGGEWGQMAGLVYDCWDDGANVIEPFRLSTDTRYYGGVDWGYTDPFVLKVRGVTPDGRHYGVSEFVQTKLTITDIVQLLKQKRETFDIRMFYCDPSQPGYIEELNRHGIPAAPADNDIRRGIDLHYELIKTRRYKEFKGACPHSADERETYHYPEPKDLGPDDNAKDPLPVDQNNHCMDADRYLTLALYRRDNKLVPKTPSESQSRDATVIHEHDRLGFLRPDQKGRSESWS